MLELQSPFTFVIFVIASLLSSNFSDRNKKILIFIMSVLFVFIHDPFSLCIIVVSFGLILLQKNKLKAAILVSILILLGFKTSFFEAIDYYGFLGEQYFPSGISFYFITLISLLYQGYSSQSVFNTAIFFPHVLAGPILHKELSFNLKEGFLKNIYISSVLFLLGCIIINSSIVLHERFEVINSLDVYNSYFVSWLFYLYIFSNFFGYSLIASGYAKLFGIEIPINFDSPALSSSPSDFWLRWHRSLSLFFRTFLYKEMLIKGVNVQLAIFSVMLISGLWHGWGAGFIVWGALHGTLILLYKVLSTYFNSKLLSVCFYIISPLTWIPFYQSSLSEIISDFYKVALLNFPEYNLLGIKFILSSVFVFILIHTPYTFMMKLMFVKARFNKKEPYGTHVTWLSDTYLYIILCMIMFILGVLYSFGFGNTIVFEYQRF